MSSENVCKLSLNELVEQERAAGRSHDRKQLRLHQVLVAIERGLQQIQTLETVETLIDQTFYRDNELDCDVAITVELRATPSN